MKKLFVTLALASLAVGAFAQGSITFQNTAGGANVKRIYGVNPSNPLQAAQGDAADYSGRPQISGTGFSAELLLSTDGATWRSLAVVGFRNPTASGAGVIAGISKLDVADIVAGTKVSLMVRAWDNVGGTVASWAELTPSVARGESKVVTNYELAGVKTDGSPTLGSGNLAAAGLESFGLYIVPEPSVVALGALGLGALLLRRRK